MYRIILLFLLPVAAYAQADTLYTLPDATVTAYRDEVSARRVGASVSTLEGRELRAVPTDDLLPGMNRLPGVRFEQRAPGSYRISVRGSTLRSPFGVRNIKVYWNGIPLTEPGGDTPLNFLDLSNVDRVELIRGPAGSLYGAGTAGTLLLTTDTLSGAVDADVAGGSYGFFRAGARVQLPFRGDGDAPSSAASYQFRLAHQQTDGYRAQSALRRQTAQFATRWRSGERREFRLHALYTKLYYELPGALNADQLAADRRQARPGSEATNASINYDNLLLGLDHRWQAGRWANVTTVYATGFYFDHPFNFDYKRETNLGTGGRTAFDYTLPLGSSVLKFSAGAETQWQLRMANNFGNETGTPTALNFSDEVVTRQHILFAQATYDLGNWRIAAGLSLNDLRYRVDRTYDAAGNPALTVSRIDPALSPRLSVLRDFGTVSVYATVSDGFSPPTLDEFRTNEGSLNVALRPERGTSYEVGTKGGGERLTYELALYSLRLRDAISTYSDDRGTQLFRNAGSTRQWGSEAAVTYRLSPRLEFYGAYTYQHYRYGDFERLGTDFTGNRLPGAAPHVVNLEARLTLPSGFYATVLENYTAAIPLDDANTVYGEAYHLLRARLGYRRQWSGHPVDFYVGGSNLLNQAMSFGNDLNPQFGGRYFQPAADRTWFVGTRLGW